MQAALLSDTQADVEIRPATLDDMEHILHHRCAMFAEMGNADHEQLSILREQTQQYLAAALTRGHYRGWLAETDERRVVAGAGLVINPWPGHPGESKALRAWILNVYTEPPYRRRGLARQLINVMLDWCRAEDLGIVSLHASPDGRALYESMGFQPTNEMRLNLRSRKKVL